MTGAIRWWQDLTSTDLSDGQWAETVAILPLAAVEQHGPHLPLSTDVDIGMGIVEEAFAVLPTTFPALCLPCLSMGASAEHGRFTGTLDVGADTLQSTIEAIGASVAASGIARLVLFISHGGNVHAAALAALHLRSKHGMLVVRCHYPAFALPDGLLPDAELRHGIHGGAIETAMMLHLHSDKVRCDRLPAGTVTPPATTTERDFRRIGPATATPFAWMAQDLDPAGVAGDASLADATLGGHLVRHYGQALADLLEETRAFPVEKLAT